MNDINLKWVHLNLRELKEEVIHAILGSGMGASSQYLNFMQDYYLKIDVPELKIKVLEIITEVLAEVESEVASRAIYIYSTLDVEDKKINILALTDKVDHLIGEIHGGKVPSNTLMKYLEYITELNRAIGRLQIFEAEPFIIKQIRILKNPAPAPPADEFFVYQLSGKSALATLKILNPLLANDYENKLL